MTTIFSKVNDLFLSSVHELLDKAIDVQSVPMVKQNVRELEDVKKKLSVETAEAQGAVMTAEREVRNVKEEMERLDDSIEVILTDGDDSNNSVAIKLQVDLDSLGSDLADRESDLDLARKTHGALSEMTRRVEIKYEEMFRSLRRLQSIDRRSKVESMTAEKLEKLGSLVGVANSVDNVSKRIEAAADKSSARLDAALDSVSDKASETVAQIQAKKKIQERIERLAQTR